MAKIAHFIIIAALALAIVPAFAAETFDRPNIVFILADDLGWKDTSVTGSTFYQTPHIDELAAQGIRFTDAYATPLCSPSRGAALTGRQPERFQMYAAITRASQDEPTGEGAEPFHKVIPPGSRSHLPTSEVTLAEVLREAGYRTHFIGKWHLGHRREHSPKQQGFDNDVISGGAAAGYFAPYKFLPRQFSKDSPEGEYLTERLTDEAIQILRREKAAEQPFFMALWHFNVHTPLQAKADVIEKYRKLVDPDCPQRNPVMAAMIEGLDDSVGRVLAALDELDLADDTIVIFASDNGGVGWTEGGEDAPNTSNLPMRSWKGTLMEGGVRVPLIIRWPGVSAPGTTTGVPAHLVDLLPTLAHAGHAVLPEGLELDGIDLRPLIEGEVKMRPRPILFYFPIAFIPNGALPAAALRAGDFKLIRFFGEGPDQTDAHELYNVAADPAESRDLATENPELLAELSKELDAELARVGARIPEPNPEYNPNAPLPRRWRGKLMQP